MSAETDQDPKNNQEPTTISKTSRIRTERNLKWMALIDEMKMLGYWAQPMFIDKWLRYRVMVVMINHLAYVLKRHPLRVYQAALCRAVRTTIGTPHTPFKQARPPRDGQSDEDPVAGLSVLCPSCGCELLDHGAATKAEVLHSISKQYKARCKSTRPSPQSPDLLRDSVHNE